MSIQSGDYLLQSNSSDDDNDGDNDDLITFQFETKTIALYYSQLSKYSKKVREEYLYTDIIKHFPSEIYDFSQQHNINSDNVVVFFQLLQENFNIEESIIITYEQCIDLFKISEFLQIDKLPKQIKKYIKNKKSNDTDFVIQIISQELNLQKESTEYQFQIKQQMESLLVSKIDECLQNEKFANLPIFIIFRIVEKSAKIQMSCDTLYDFIKKSISKFCTLFQFLDLKKLSDDRLCELCETYSKADEKSRQFFGYLNCNLILIKELNEEKKELQKNLDVNDEKRRKLTSSVKELNEKSEKLQKKLDATEAERDELTRNIKELKSLNDQIQTQLNDSENSKKQMEQQISRLHKQLNDSENEKNSLQAQIEEERKAIDGYISANVKDGLIFNGEIHLNEKKYPLDTSRSKYNVSTSDAKKLGSPAYEKGEPITSLVQKTVDFGAKQVSTTSELLYLTKTEIQLKYSAIQ